eukprot:scaffold5691_cov25-Tisochrysis_lutea.AAC.1
MGGLLQVSPMERELGTGRVSCALGSSSWVGGAPLSRALRVRGPWRRAWPDHPSRRGWRQGRRGAARAPWPYRFKAIVGVFTQ